MNTSLTKKQYEDLKPYEEKIIAAFKQNFVHMSGSDFRNVEAIYKEINGGKGLNPSQMNCNTCRLNVLRKLGELYSRYGEEKKKTRSKKLEKDVKEE